MTQENKRRRAFSVGGRWQTALSLTGAIFYVLSGLEDGIVYPYELQFGITLVHRYTMLTWTTWGPNPNFFKNTVDIVIAALR